MSSIEDIMADTNILEEYMSLALKEAKNSLPSDVPIGAMVMDSKTTKIIATSGNSREEDNDPTAHAEIIAIRKASKAIGDWRLNDLIIFSTLEPCIMCAGTLIQARIGGLVFGARDPQYGAAGSIYNFFTDTRLMHNPAIKGGILEDECGKLLHSFFKQRRQTDTKPTE